MVSEILAPYITLVNVSLPSSSVPRGCANEGAKSLSFKLCAFGPYAHITFANTAQNIIIKITIREKNASLFCLITVFSFSTRLSSISISVSKTDSLSIFLLILSFFFITLSISPF